MPPLKGLEEFNTTNTQDSACPPQFPQKRRELGTPAAAPSWAELSRPAGRDGVPDTLKLSRQVRLLLIAQMSTGRPYREVHTSVLVGTFDSAESAG